MRQTLERLLGKPAEHEGKIIQINDLPSCHSLWEKEFTILVKHSAACSFSRQKLKEICQFFSSHPEITIHVLFVQTARAASTLVEQYTGICHETPQVLAMVKGVVIAHASHARITKDFLAELTSERKKHWITPQ